MTRLLKQLKFKYLQMLQDLVNQTKECCSDDTKIPSKALVRLQFTPRNPYSHAALRFTSRFDVQYKIQRRQLRAAHPVQHYAAAQLKYRPETLYSPA